MRKKDAKASLGCGSLALILIGMFGLWSLFTRFIPPPNGLTPSAECYSLPIKHESVRVGYYKYLGFDFEQYKGSCLTTVDSVVEGPSDTVRISNRKGIEVEVTYNHMELNSSSRFEVIPDPRESRRRTIILLGKSRSERIDEGRAIAYFTPGHYVPFGMGGTVKLELILETPSGGFSKVWVFEVLRDGESVSAIDDRDRIAQEFKPSGLPVPVRPDIANPVVDRERQAQGKLRLGKQFIDKGRPASSVPWLVAVLEQFPETAAAKEAELLYPKVTGKKFERVATQKAAVDQDEGVGSGGTTVEAPQPEGK